MPTVNTNHQPRDLFAASELTPAALATHGLDYIEGDDMFTPRLFRYKGHIYDVSEFMAFRSPWADPSNPLAKDWDGIQSDSFFSAIVIKYANDYESVIVGTYFS